MLPVYLVHWNAPDWCGSAIASLLASDVPVRATVIDNGPEAASAQLRRLLPDEVEVVAPAVNGGYTAGANLAIDHWLTTTEAPYAVVGAHDLHVDPDTLGRLVAAAEAAPGFGILAPREGEPRTGAPGLLDVDWVSGGCLLLRRACLQVIGGFDELIGSYVEDVDLCWRAQALGWRVGEHQDLTYRGLGSVSPMRVKTIKLNTIKVLARHRGMRAAVLSAGALALTTARTRLTSVAPGRAAEQRTASREHFQNNAAALRVALRPSFWREVQAFHRTPPRAAVGRVGLEPTTEGL